MSEENVSNGNEDAPVTREYVLNYLIGMGVNSVIGSYNAEQAKFAEDFISLPLVDISPVWLHLNDKAKVKVLDVHHEELIEWLNSGARQ